jgi:lipoyl-dependent peroxiredoxin
MVGKVTPSTSEGGSTMPVRSGDAEWNGTFKEGSGTTRSGSGAFEVAFTAGTRFEDDPGTNPEELVAAAFAGCYSMALTLNLEKAGYAPEHVATKTDVQFDKLEQGFTMTKFTLSTEASVPGIDDAEFQKIAEHTKTTCPVSRALAAVPAELTATLAG